MERKITYILYRARSTINKIRETIVQSGICENKSIYKNE